MVFWMVGNTIGVFDSYEYYFTLHRLWMVLWLGAWGFVCGMVALGLRVGGLAGWGIHMGTEWTGWELIGWEYIAWNGMVLD